MAARKVLPLGALLACAAIAYPLTAQEQRNTVRLTYSDSVDQPARASLSDASTSSAATAAARSTEPTMSKKSGRYLLPDDVRSGCPFGVLRFARPAVCADYEVGFIGGGSLLIGENRRQHEGIFGLDYSGLLLSRKTWLKWSHGALHKGGAGAYATDGPKLVE